MIYESKTQQETETLGEKLASKAECGDIYCLIGGLGSGKTAFARGFARGLGISGEITSPTFTIVNTYIGTGRLNLYHFDVYRLNNLDEMDDTGYEEYFYGDGVTLLEWADLIEELWPQNAIIVRFERVLERGLNYREIKVTQRVAADEYSGY